TWVAVANGTTVSNSWIFGAPDVPTINGANTGANAWWTGDNNQSYYNNEDSFVIGPCLNISDLKRPMISLKYFVDAQTGFDGAVVQYSINGGNTWVEVGDAEGAGINWYNSRNLNGEPGGQSNFGWSGEDTEWRDGRYNLDQIPVASRNSVIFRIAFGSNDDNLVGEIVDGFAFDDIFIGEKSRNVLVEHFTNSDPSVRPTTGQLEQVYNDQFLVKDSSDFVLVQYHMANPSEDDINKSNPTDPQARAFLYGVAQPPTTVMDGIQGDYFGTNFTGAPALITAEELDRRALESPQFEITFAPVAGNPDSPVEVAVTFRYIDSLKAYTTPVTLHAGLLERGVPNSGTVDGTVNVMRKLLLTGAGNTLTRTWTYGDSETVNISYVLDVPIVNPDSLYLLAFVQDHLLNSKRLLQSAIVKSQPKNGITVVGLPDDPISGEIRELVVYPNPASQYFNISSEANLSREYTWQLIDQRGVTVLSGDLYQDFTHGAQTVDVGGLANGIYFLAIQTGEKSIVHKKLAIMNKN
ncbi:MAG TPA: T9SS type A sorting domain-containing protein, partial [Chryseolinea sp.]|nr:T9SS type A sorting domain-containing protein [Chryseolinea sp.]